MFRPSQPDLVAKRLQDVELQFTASKDYLERHGEPKSVDELENHPIIGFDRELEIEKAVEILGLSFSKLTVISKTDFLPLQIELARNGAGITITHRQIIAQMEQLQPILTEVPIPNLEFWLVCHADVQHNRRIRTLMDFLAGAFS